MLRHLLAAVNQLQRLLAQPLVVGGCVTPPAHQVARYSARPAAVGQHLVLALLSRVGDGPRGRWGPDTLKEGFEAVDVDGRAAAQATPQREGAGVGARAASTVKGPSHRGRSLPMSASSSSSLVRSSTRSPTWNTVSTRPASSFAFRSACAAASSSRTVASIARIRFA